MNEIRKLSGEYPIHITARCNNKTVFPIPLSDAWELFSDYLHLIHHHYNIKIHSFVLMSNHFHLIVSDPELNLSKAMAVFMRETSKEIGRMSGRINKTWGTRFHSCIIQNTQYYQSAYKYNYRNPVAAGICKRVEEYPWSSIQLLLGKKKGLIPLLEDETLFSDPEGTLNWLNEPYKKEEAEALQLATQKKILLTL